MYATRAVMVVVVVDLCSRGVNWCWWWLLLTMMLECGGGGGGDESTVRVCRCARSDAFARRRAGEYAVIIATTRINFYFT